MPPTDGPAGPNGMDPGEPARPTRRAPRGLVVGLVAALAVGALALSATRGGDPAPPPSPSPTPVADAPSQTAIPAETDPPSLPVRGPAATGLRGRVVLVENGAAAVLDLASGERTALGEVSSPVRHAVRAGRSVVLFGGEGTGDFPPLPNPVWVVGADLRVRRLPDAGSVIPDADGTGVWLTTWLPDGSSGTMRRVGLDGRVTGRFELPGPRAVVAATRAGIVLSDLLDDAVEVWDPARTKLVHREPGKGFAAAAPARLVWWHDRCSPVCLLTWHDLPSAFRGGTRGRGLVEVPDEPRRAHLSPDGRWVVTQSVGQRVSVVACELEEAHCVVFGNARTTEFFETSWLADGRTMLAATEPALGQLVAWRPGWTELRPLPGTFRVDGLAALGT